MFAGVRIDEWSAASLTVRETDETTDAQFLDESERYPEAGSFVAISRTFLDDLNGERFAGTVSVLK